ncbi:MAG: EAL domain-containing protein [Alphaproteobacteria bacterium]|nr:EAL domain-containing protein [Alphaproteobacteria bacterium]
MLSVRFQTKLTLVYLALFLGVMGIILFAFYRSVTSNVQEQTRAQLDASARVFERIVNYRVDTLGESAVALAQDYGFREAIGTNDQPTVLSSLRNQTRRLAADIGVITDIDGELIAGLVDGNSAINVPGLDDAIKQRAEREGFATKLVAFEGRVFELVVTTVRAPVPIAWLAFGIELDKEAALEIQALSSIDLGIAFLYRAGDNGFSVAAATENQAELAAFLKETDTQNEIFSSSFMKQDHMFSRLTLEDGAEGDGVAALLYYSMDSALAPYNPLVITMVTVLGLSLLLLISGSVVVARGVTRPLRRLAGAAQQIAKGQYKAVDVGSRGDEVADLTNSFNQMVSAVQEREGKIRFQAYHDVETGLGNRLMFENLVSAEIEESDSFVLVVAEIQQLPELRTVLNHQNINDLVKAIAERLAKVTDAEVARVSTEAFGFVIRDAREAEVVASLVINSFMTPFDVADIVIDAGVKMGLVKYPGDGEDMATLFRHAQAALDKGRGMPRGFAWYDPDRDSSQKARLSMMSELRVGLKNGEVRFAYQPKLDLATGKITAVEALIRWISPTRGFVPPDDFIPMAERTGDVRHVTEWGLKTAVEQAAVWRKGGLNLAVAINLSSSDLMNQALPSQILVLLKEHDLPPELLKLEVTESAVMNDMNRALEVLNMLSAMGLSLSIDDYGTGYSSLSYIKRLPVSEIKIDKSFVLNLAKSDEDNILVRSTIELGHNLGLSVTAEGVEDEESVEKLRQYGCDVLQGYHIARPLPVAELEAFLQESEYGPGK